MISIAKCNNRKCEKRFSCYRYVTPVNPKCQRWIEYSIDNGKNCEMFYRIVDIECAYEDIELKHNQEIEDVNREVFIKLRKTALETYIYIIKEGCILEKKVVY